MRERRSPFSSLRLATALAAVAAALSPSAASGFSAGTTELITRPGGALPVAANGTGRSGLELASSDGSVIGGRQVSQDGRYIVFVSDADDLSGEDDDTVENVFVRDTVANTTELVSRADGAAGAAADASSFLPAISDDGTTVAFTTGAALDPGDDDSGFYDVYLRRLSHHPTHPNTTAWVPVTDPGNTSSPSLDETGSHVAAQTQVDIDAKDDNSLAYDVYVWDIPDPGDPFPAPELASIDNADTAALDDNSTAPSLSDDGAVVAFETFSDELDAGDTNGDWDVAVRDLTADTTVLASRAAGGAGAVGDGRSKAPALNGDGTVVAFRSRAANLVAGDGNGDEDVFRRRLDTNAIGRVSLTSADGEIDEPSGSAHPSVSDDGDRVTFTNARTGIVASDDEVAPKQRVYVRDVSIGATLLASRRSGAGADDVRGSSASISGDGRVVAFASTDDAASDEDDDSQDHHVHARRLPDYVPAPAGSTTILIDRPTGTAPFTGTSQVDAARINAGATSWDGRRVAFLSDADDLAAGLDPAIRNAFVRDTQDETTVLLNAPGTDVGRVVLSADGRKALFTAGPAYVRDLGAPSNQPEVVSLDAANAPKFVTPSGGLALSGDGKRAAFTTTAKLTPADTDILDDVYVRDLVTGTTILASAPDDEAPDDGPSQWPSLDWDGSHVAFESAATNLLGAGNDTNGRRDVFVRDLVAGTTVAASRATGPGGTLGDDDSSAPALDGDGRRVAFTSAAGNLGGVGGTSEVFVRDLAAGQTDALGGTGADDRPSMSEDGARVAFVSASNSLEPGGADTSSAPDVYVRTPNGYVLASRADGVSGAVGNAGSGGVLSYGDGPALSPNGDCVAFPSLAGNLDPADWSGTGVQLGYLRVTGTQCPDTTAPLAAIDAGPAGTTADTAPTFEFSADERRASFECRLDGAGFAPCSSPFTTPTLAEGPHTFEVRAVDVPGNVQSTPTTRAFTIDVPDPPSAVPAPAPPIAATPSAAAPPPVPKDPAKLKVLRAGVADGVLDMLVEITSNAAVPGADLDVAYQSSGRTTRFSVPISSGKAAARGPHARIAERRITIRRTLPGTQPKNTGIVELRYAGNDRVQPDEVRLRAAAVKALLVRKAASLADGRLKVNGTISAKARGVVRVRLGYALADGSTGFTTFNATIGKGVWKVDRTLTGDAAKGGYLSIQFTGYEAAGMRGEQTGKAVP